MAKCGNAQFSDFNKAALSNRTYKDATGKVFEVHFAVNYVAVDPNNKNDKNFAAYNEAVNGKHGSNGNNVIQMENVGSVFLQTFEGSTVKNRSNAGGHASLNYYDKEEMLGGNGKMQTKFKDGDYTGNLAYVAYGAADETTMIHETFHLFGLGDRYIEGVKYDYVVNGKVTDYNIVQKTSNYAGYDNDLMNKNSMSAFNQEHIDNMSKAALAKVGSQGGTGVIDTKVDKANKKDKNNAVKTLEDKHYVKSANQ